MWGIVRMRLILLYLCGLFRRFDEVNCVMHFSLLFNVKKGRPMRWVVGLNRLGTVCFRYHELVHA